jgi:hypothetical protein
MTQPDELQVIATSLGNAAGVWDQQAAALRSASARAGEMTLNRLEAGIFQIIVGPYDAVVAQVSARCEEGSSSLHRIASALELAADEYSEAEQATGSNIRRVLALRGMRP